MEPVLTLDPMTEPDVEAETQDARARVLDAASRLLAGGGRQALTTRAVASAASVQAPTLYRLFGEKQGLLDAVAEHVLASFVADKAVHPPHPDPVEDLRAGWDSYVAFGLANPAVFAIINEIGEPTSGSPATLAGVAVLRERVERVARAGRLGVSVDRAVALIHAAGLGTVATLIATKEKARDLHLSPSTRDAVLSAILTPSSTPGKDSGRASLAIALRARLREISDLTPGEHLLLTELLDRLSKSH
uniref:TetR/AcrR family transcriptional regulator n=1 Tax=uncultured Sphingomonas sp. TaxID=158754 RepID=UPI0035CA93C4